VVAVNPEYNMLRPRQLAGAVESAVRLLSAARREL